MKTKFKYFLRALAVICILLFMLAAGLIYMAEFKPNNVAASVSPDGKYELLFRQIGEPEWPFGRTHAELVLKAEGKIILRHRFNVANDGGALLQNNWSVSWERECVRAVITGEEQAPDIYVLNYNGTVTRNTDDADFNKAAPDIDFSALVFESEEQESAFALSIDEFIECYNREFEKTYGSAYLSPVNADNWYLYKETSPRFGYPATRYMFTEDKSVWPMPTLSIYSKDNSSVYEIRVTFDDHGYQEKFYYKFRDMCRCLMALSCPTLSEDETDALFDSLYRMAYDNFFGDSHRFEDADRPCLTAVYRYGSVGLYSFYGSGNIEICLLPLSDSAAEKIAADGTEIIDLEEGLREKS